MNDRPQAMPGRNPSPWSEALDEFEHRLQRYRDVLERDVEPIGGTWPSPALNGQGLPIELVDRARQLLGEASNLEARLKAKQDALEVSRSPSPRPRHLPPRSTRSTDL